MQLAKSLRAGRSAAVQRPANVTSFHVQARKVTAHAATEEIAAVAASSNGTGASNTLDFEELSDIIRIVNDTDIVELELKSKRFNLSVKKQAALKAAEPTVQPWQC
ncbi:acetyl-coa biotin carboxyl carrier [Monoraphidium neglectum]|uniref:Acetyl-coa biotin carboxyl carrier n=1 Tax=Monoraphidium neglectum TaxID=145388 RepID=A0A0D2K6G4_9CHLO|nr:acetyl-coa biotin carboxyl carrier [Monoraphidium neglectum]KIY91778.1 acetyl-coa biotin carboxyl carrier [Monoraphidium neglectum]|eukprot:XP_013890798.1 acetyl-coa biotin carboxyl carrier [Monoraphidium neglectum]